ncbi:hypothetical protein CW273_17500 [Escherichia coli]|nr:hypothetical protein CW273_17500 [Escherichia coli]PLB79294.1 hypothetical protein APX96_01730 [Escherichia coli]PWD23256.1 hypothetical protein APX98_22250 [Escherichia coli]PWD26327.1 hypothetical protein APX97_17005 [Escherichia coli]PWD32008.1 hypothetical protein APY00_15855 [Escherichia coli]
MICSRRSLVPVTRFSPEASVLLIVSPFVKLSFHFVLPINAFLLSKCKPTLPIGASYSRFSDFHYVSFVNQIRKLLSFVLFLSHHDAVSTETKRKINISVI